MKKLKRIVAVFLAVVLVFGAVAWAETTSQKSTGKVGILMPSIVVARWAMDAESMVEYCKKLGLEPEVQFADDKIENQISQCENMIAKKYDVLIICPVNAEALGSVLENVKAAGIGVISYDRLIRGTTFVDYYVTFDNILVGEVCGNYIVEHFKLKDGKGPFNMEIFTGDIADNNAKMTLQGGMNVLQKYIDNGQLVVQSGQTKLGEVQTTGWDGANAQSRMDNIMSAFYTNKHLDLILSTYGGMSLGCIASLKALGYGTVEEMPFITAQDAELAIVQSVVAGDLAMTIFKDTRVLGQKAAEIAFSYIKGEKVQLDESKYYDNGAFKVPSYLAGVLPFDKAGVDAAVIDTGYWTHAEVYGN